MLYYVNHETELDGLLLAYRQRDYQRIYTVEGSLRAGCQPIVSLDEQDECDCVAFRKWNLPCQHMLELWIFVGTDLEPNWERYSSTFDDAMFNIYEAQKVVIQ
jgi:hypothetical protein